MTPELPSSGGRRFVTDGGLETDLIFHHDIDLPDFAVFPLVEYDGGRALLRDYYLPYVDVARRAGAGIILETGTWRANPDWGARLGYAADRLHAVNMEFVRFLQELRDRSCSDLPQAVVSGMIGPRGDGYRAGYLSIEAARAYHRPQLNAFAEAGADLAGAFTMATASEAIGISLAAMDVGIPVAISFTVETDGRLPDGTSLAASIEQVERAAPPAYYLLNCAHPDHLARALSDPDRGATGSSAPESTPRAFRTPSSTRPRSWTTATPSTWLPRTLASNPHSAPRPSSAGAAAPTCGTSLSSGAFQPPQWRKGD